jgi:hypothetical protein
MISSVCHLAKLVAICAVTSVCASCKHEQVAFPIISAASPLEVFNLQTIPPKKICATDSADRATVFFEALKSRYPDGWHTPKKFVSIAESYRILAGETMLTMTEHSLFVHFMMDGKKTILGRTIESGEAHVVISMACN